MRAIVTLEDDAERELGTLSQQNAANWLRIGKALLALEKLSRTAPAGKSWAEVLRERLEKLGAEVSPGHIHKIRRATSFLKEYAPEALEAGLERPPGISSIEIAERLHRLDSSAGLRALTDALAPNPSPYVELKRRYDLALEERPEMKSPRQVAWETRRKAEQVPSQGNTSLPAGNTAAASKAEKDGPRKQLSNELAKLVDRIWKDGWHTAERKYLSEIESLRSQIRAFEEAAGAETYAEQRLTEQEAEHLHRLLGDQHTEIERLKLEVIRLQHQLEDARQSSN